MKETTGATILMGLAAVIIIIFITMVAFFISYGKSFKLKNSIISKIEQSEGMTKTEIENYIVNKKSIYNSQTDPEICVNRIMLGTNYRGFTINVTVYMEMDAEIMGDIFNPKIPIKGETRIIESGIIYEACKNGVMACETALGLDMCE